jgi:hypothetical protein
VTAPGAGTCCSPAGSRAGWPATSSERRSAPPRRPQPADRFGDHELLAVSLMDRGRSLLRLDRLEEGLRSLDEAIVAAQAAELAPVPAGLIYRSVHDGCREVYEFARLCEWTDLLTRWCERQPGLVAFTGVCQLHRAEVMEMRGAWDAALDEARAAREHCARVSEQASARRGDLQGGGDPPAARRARRGRGGVSRCEPSGPRAAAGARTAAAGAGRPRGGRRGDSPGRLRARRDLRARRRPAWVRRGHARCGGCRRGAARRLRAGADRRRERQRRRERDGGREPRARSTRPGGRTGGARHGRGAQVVTEWDSAEEFTSFNRDIVPPLRVLLAQCDEREQDEALAAIADAARLHCDADRRLRLPNLALLAVGRA